MTFLLAKFFLCRDTNDQSSSEPLKCYVIVSEAPVIYWVEHIELGRIGCEECLARQSRASLPGFCG